MSNITVQDRPGGIRFRVHVQPRASRSEVAGVRDGALRVRVSAPPVDGAANEAVVELLARAFGLARRSVRVVAGATARLKTIEVDGIDRTHLERLTLATSPTPNDPGS